MPPVGFEPTIPASTRPQTYTLDSAATGIGVLCNVYLNPYVQCASGDSGLGFFTASRRVDSTTVVYYTRGRIRMECRQTVAAPSSVITIINGPSSCGIDTEGQADMIASVTVSHAFSKTPKGRHFMS
jgi:hypothetical protein